MLKKIKIRNFALIEDMEIELGKGLTVITGESGSGKSLLLDAISSILGSRCSTINIRNGIERYILEALFEISDNLDAIDWLKSKGFSTNESELLLKKELSLDGKSRVFINGSLASTSLLKEIGSILSEVHRQNDQLYLLEKKSQLEILDHFAGLENILIELKQSFQTYKKVKQRLDEVIIHEDLLKQKQDILNYQIREIEAANLKTGEDIELTREENLLSKGEKLAENYTIMINLLEKSENSILESMNKVLQSANKIEIVNQDFAEVHTDLQEIYYKLKEYTGLIKEEGEDLYFSAERLDVVQNRIDELDKLKKKYGSDLSEILNFKDKIATELEAIEMGDALKHSLKKDLINATANLSRLSLKLSELRRISIQKFEEVISNEFAELGMDEAKLQVVLRWEQSTEGEINENGKKYLVNETGLDQIDFYFCPNPGEKPRPLRKIASGGEISRVMLGIKNIMRKSQKNKLMIFDEIDTGISGDVAYNVAKKLKNISAESQVILVTHMQPITAISDQHIKVEKITEMGRSYSTSRNLTMFERPVELAKMVAGENITQGSLDHAYELLNRKAV